MAFTTGPCLRSVIGLRRSCNGRTRGARTNLPEFKRTRQIAARLRDESFVGTDFTFRDFAILTDVLRWGETEAPSKLLGEEAVNGSACHKIELRPRQGGMPYPWLVVWMERDRLTPRQLDFDEADAQRYLDRGGP